MCAGSGSAVPPSQLPGITHRGSALSLPRFELQLLPYLSHSNAPNKYARLNIQLILGVSHVFIYGHCLWPEKAPPTAQHSPHSGSHPCCTHLLAELIQSAKIPLNFPFSSCQDFYIHVRAPRHCTSCIKAARKI